MLYRRSGHTFVSTQSAVTSKHNEQSFDGSRACFAVPCPPNSSYQKILGHYFIDAEEYSESIKQYLAGNTSHPLVDKFGWVKTTAIKHVPYVGD